MKNVKKSLAILLVLCMVFTLLPLSAFADGETEALPESDHNYASNTNQTWTYTLDGADNGVVVTFDDQTRTESGYDFIYIYDGDDNQIGRYSGTALAGASVAVPTATVKIRLTSDSSANYWGFAVTSIVAVEKGNLEQPGTTTVADIPSIMLGRDDAEPVPEVTYLGNELTAGTDFTVSYADNDKAGTATVTITGTGSYYGSVTATFQIADENNLLTPASVNTTNILLRQAGDTGTSYVPFANVTDDWVNSIESITLTPVDADGSETDTGDAEYPHAPETITFTQEDYGTKWFVSGNNIYFYRTSEEPVVYVMQGHEPVEIQGRWSTNTYPQSQTYAVTVEADKYEDATGTVTYYTGTAPAFSIIVVDEDGTEEVVKTWTSEEIEEMATFASGSSQCGMTGFRTFSGMGVSLKDLLAEANVTVSDSDYFLLDTSDHYGNNFTYEQLFGTTRYFLSGIYDDDFAEIYNRLVSSDDEAGATLELRQELAERAVEANSTIEPRINVSYNETLIYGDQVASAAMPAEDDPYSELVCYENQFRFFYGIALVDTATVTFNSNGGSAVDSQTISVPVMTSTENTTIRSSYWANSLVIYRGQGEQYKTEAPEIVDSITEPTAPTRSGYTFGGWYTDRNCTEGNEFDFETDAVTDSITLYAKWIPAAQPTVVDYTVGSAEHDDEDAEVNQTIIITVQFSDEIALLSEDLSEDLTITISGQNVLETARDVTYAVDEDDATKLVITLVSNDWAAVYGGLLNINEAEGGIQNIVSAADETTPVEWTNLETYIPIGIELENDPTAGTADSAATTTVTVTHKANMRGMYHFQLLSNGVPVGDVTTAGYYYAAAMTSHAHAFYTSITPETIAAAIATGINNYCEGYTAVYNEDTATLTVTADTATEGEVLTVQMFEYNADGRTVDPLLRSAIAKGQSYLDSTVAYTTASAAVLEQAIDDAKALIGTDPSLREQADAKAAIADAIAGLEVAQGLTIVDFTVGSAEHEDADEEVNQTIIITVEFSDEIALLSEDLSEDLTITISGQNVLETARDVAYAVDETDATKLVITLVSNDWAAVYGGLLNINEAEGGVKNIVAADGVIDATDPVPVEWTNLETYIPIGIALTNDTTAGTAEEPATTTVTVTHKANMRGMYHFQLLSNGVPVGDVTTSGYYFAAAMTSHAHAFYTTVDEAYIASAIATAINNYCEGYTAVYNEDTATLTVTADSATEGEVLTVQMFEYNADGRTVDPLLRQAAAKGRSYLDGDIIYPAEATAALENAIAAAEALIGTNPSLQAQADVKAAISAAIEGLFGSEHPYPNGTDQSWTYTLEGAEYGIVVTFDDQTKTESNYDLIYIYDGDGNLIGTYSGTELAGASVEVPTSSVTIRLTSDSSVNYYGFRISGIVAAEAPDNPEDPDTPVIVYPGTPTTPDETVPAITLPYIDVDSGDWYYDAVAYMYANRIMTGVTANTFVPNMSATRATIVTMLHRLEGTPAAASANFQDVAPGQWYTAAVNWAASTSVVLGYGNGNFGPDDEITRQDLVVILYRYAQYKGYNTSAAANLSAYTDVGSVSSYALAAMQWAVAEGLVTSASTTALVLNPLGNASRAEIATLFMRFMENIR